MIASAKALWKEHAYSVWGTARRPKQSEWGGESNKKKKIEDGSRGQCGD